MERYDAIVVGVGGVGSAATYHLARRGADVLGLERFDVPHAMGSSHGSTRIIRLAYHEHPWYVPLLERAYELWRGLEAESGRDLLYVTGSVTAGPAGSETPTGARRTCREHGIDHEELSGAEVNERFDAYEVPEGYEAIYQPDGGFLDCERCVGAHVEGAFAHGGEVHAREPVTGWESTGDGVRVETDRAEYAADRLVVTAGAWAARHVDALEGLLTPERHVMGWFQPDDPGAFTPDRFPVFVIDTEEDGYYGFPRHDVPGFKFGGEAALPADVDPDGMDRQPGREAEEYLRPFAERFFPSGAGPTMRLTACLITRTPDERFIVDALPDDPNVVIGAGFSGHGFKMSAAIGEALADLATEGETDRDVSRFRLDRFD